MTYESIRETLMQHFNEFTGIDKSSVDYPNRKLPFKQPNTGLWCRLSIQYGESFMAGMAEKPYTRITGRLVIQCFSREGDGIGSLSRLADKLIDHFSYWKDGHLECLEGGLVDVGRNNDFYQYNVIIRFRAG